MADIFNGLGIELWHVFLLSVASLAVSILHVLLARAEKIKKDIKDKPGD